MVCDCVVVVGEGRTLFAKNSDRDPNESQVVEWHPRATHPPGTTVPCTWIAIPQAAETNAVVLSRPYWMWGAEMGANAHGLVIGNEAVFTREPYAATGLTGMDLVRLALERACTARGAVSTLVNLLERYGQGGGCGHENRRFTYHNSFLIADPSEAWVLETAGKHWAEERVVRGVRSISNGLTIPGFARRHGDRIRTAVSGSRPRRAVTGAVPPSSGVLDLISLLRSHGRSVLPAYSSVNGGLRAPCVHASGLLASSQTTASWIADLAPDAQTHWVTGTAAPCASLFKPVTVERPVDTGPLPDDRADPATLWWRNERLHRVAVTDAPRLYPLFTAERDAVERRWVAELPDAGSAFQEADELLERWVARVSAAAGRDRRPWWVRRYWAVRDERAALDRPVSEGVVR